MVHCKCLPFNPFSKFFLYSCIKQIISFNFENIKIYYYFCKRFMPNYIHWLLTADYDEDTNTKEINDSHLSCCDYGKNSLYV